MAKEFKKWKSGSFVVGEARASYAYVFTPRVDEDTKEVTSFGITLMFDKNGSAFVKKSIADIQANVDKAFNDLIEGGWITEKQANAMKEDVKACAWRDGDGDWNMQGGEYKHPEYAGHMILVCSNKLKTQSGELIPPKVYYPKGGEITDSRDFISGDYCFSEITISTYNNKSIGVTAFFNSVKKSRSGEPLGSVSAREEAYDAVLSEFPDAPKDQEGEKPADKKEGKAFE